MLWSMKFFGWKLIKALIFGEVWNDSKFKISFGLMYVLNFYPPKYSFRILISS